MNYSKKTILAVLIVVFAVSFSFSQSESSKDETFSSSQIEDSQVTLDFSDTLDSSSESFVGQSGGVAGGIWIFVRMIIVLAIIIAAIYFLFKFMRKSMGGETLPDEDDVFLRKVSFLSLGDGKSVQIVSLWNEAFILGVSGDSVSLLKEIKDKELIDAMNRYADMNSKTNKPRSFEEILSLFMPSRVSSNEEKKENTSKRKSAYDEETMNLINSLKEKRISGSGEEE